jgi:hypothetical protein
MVTPFQHTSRLSENSSIPGNHSNAAPTHAPFFLLGISYAIGNNLVQSRAMSMFFTPNCSEFISLPNHVKHFWQNTEEDRVIIHFLIWGQCQSWLNMGRVAIYGTVCIDIIFYHSWSRSCTLQRISTTPGLTQVGYASEDYILLEFDRVLSISLAIRYAVHLELKTCASSCYYY